MNPVKGYGVTTAYRKTGRLWKLGFHTGADIAAPTGTPIVSATPGTVIVGQRYSSSYGYFTIIRWNGLDVWYCHQPKNASRVKTGQRVNAGQRIGSVGSTGNVTGSHLHLEVRIAGAGFAAGNFRNPITVINYQEDPEMALSDEDIRRIAEAVWNADVIPIEEPTVSAADLERNPTWTAKGAIGKLLKRQAQSEPKERFGT